MSRDKSPVASYQDLKSRELNMIRILLVDDQRSIRERLKSLLETESDFEIVGMVDNGYDAIEQVKLLLPDVVLMDMEMPEIDGILATKIISHSSLKTKVLVLSSYDSDEYVAKSIQSGANGYLLKGAPPQEIRDAIRFVNRGYMQIAPGLFEKFMPCSNVAKKPPDPQQSKPSKSSSSRADFRSRPNLTGINPFLKTHSKSALSRPDFDQPSELILDVTAQFSRKSIGWYQATGLLIAALGLTGGVYFLRKGIDRTIGSISQETGSEPSRPELQDLPFTGKIEPLQVLDITATSPGIISDIQVKIDQSVKAGDRLVTIENTDAERVNQEKIRQQQQLATQQQQATQQLAAQQQQQKIQQQQTLISEQQAASGRVNTLQQEIASYERNLAPLRQEVAAANIDATVAMDRQVQSAIPQKREAITRAQAIYDRTLANYQQLAQYQTEGAISQSQLDRAETEMTIAKSDLNIATEDYNSAIVSAKTEANKQLAQTKVARLQQQLALKEQAVQFQKLRSDLQVAQSNHRRISTRLQQLQQQQPPFIPPSSSTTDKLALEPTLVHVVAPSAGIAIGLPISLGNRVVVGSKLLAIADTQKLKISVNLSRQQAAQLKLGQRAIIKVSRSNISQEFTGNITTIEPSSVSVSPPSNNRSTQKVQIEFTNANRTILFGQTATVYFPK
jgi:hemolysin D